VDARAVVDAPTVVDAQAVGAFLELTQRPLEIEDGSDDEAS